MKNELFGPILTIYIFDDNDFDDILNKIDTTSDYALTGAIFAKNRDIIIKMFG